MATAGKTRTRVIAGLSRPAIARTALELIDRDGLAAFSMRRLAAELGVQVGALYVHVPDRDALLVDVSMLVADEVRLPTSPAWDDWLAAFARRWRRAVRRHPHTAALMGTLVSSAGDLDLVEAILGALHRGGFRGRALVEGYNAFLGALVGVVTLELTPAPPSVDVDSHPLLRELLATAPSHPSAEAAFTAAIGVVIEGLRQALR
ncbi:MAG TPA: TetR family transcriptional regulator [Mycobacteriales bacterium]|nr:TetR family transcriptional regulator [Mycobacteriales bacterium]